jgi:microcin C transport system substrate-binding protein
MRDDRPWMDKRQRIYPPVHISLCAILIALGSHSLSATAAIVTSNAIALQGVPLHGRATALPYANPDAPKGGEFSTMAEGTFDSLNALINKGTAVDGTAYLSDSLLSASLDEPTVSYGLLAERISRDPLDPSWIIFHLNPHAYFSNHQAVTADDVVYTFDILRLQGAPGLRSYYGDIAAVTALDPHTVRFNFKSRSNPKLAFAIGQMPILSRLDNQRRPFSQVSLTPQLGSGPYLVEQIDAGRSISYRRNPNYWGRDLMVNRGRYNFDRIRYVYYRDHAAAFEGFKRHEYSFRLEKSEQAWTRGYDFAAVQQGKVVKTVIPNKNPVTMTGLVFNLRKAKFQDIRVRQALTLAFDFEWLNRAVLGGVYTRLQSYFFNSELAATGVPTPAELKVLQPPMGQLSTLEQQAILQPWQAPHSAGDGFNRVNLLKARQLLLDAGYQYREGALVDQHGKPYLLEILTKDESQQRIFLPYVRNLRKLGINASIRVVDIPQYIERTRRFDADMVLDSFPQTLTPGSEQVGYWGSSTAAASGSLNSAGIQNPVVDALMSQILVTTDRQTLLTLSHALDRVLRAGYYMVPLYGFVGNRVAYWNQYQLPQVPPAYDVGVDFWWSTPATANPTLQGAR